MVRKGGWGGGNALCQCGSSQDRSRNINLCVCVYVGGDGGAEWMQMGEDLVYRGNIISR